jgi:hypothetical protein
MTDMVTTMVSKDCCSLIFQESDRSCHDQDIQPGEWFSCIWFC